MKSVAVAENAVPDVANDGQLASAKTDGVNGHAILTDDDTSAVNCLIPHHSLHSLTLTHH